MKCIKQNTFQPLKRMKWHGKDVPFKNKSRSKTTHRAIVVEKLFDIPLMGASNNALSGVVKPPAMLMVTDFFTKTNFGNFLDTSGARNSCNMLMENHV